MDVGGFFVRWLTLVDAAQWSADVLVVGFVARWLWVRYRRRQACGEDERQA